MKIIKLKEKKRKPLHESYFQRIFLIISHKHKEQYLHLRGRMNFPSWGEASEASGEAPSKLCFII